MCTINDWYCGIYRIVGDGKCVWQVALTENLKKGAQRKVSGAHCIVYGTCGVNHLNPSVHYIYHQV
jgi:hypothetical protein